MTKELSPTTGDYTKGEAQSTAEKLSETPAHDAALWAEKATEAAQHAAASLAKATRAQKGGGA